MKMPNVDSRGSNRGPQWVAVVFAWMALLSCGGDDGTGPAAVRVAAVEVTGAGNVLAAGQTMQLTAIARDSLNAAIAGTSITWTTSTATVATVSTTGLVRAISAGSATVTASSGGKSGTWDVVVRDTTPLPRVLRGRIERVDAMLSGTYTVTGDLVLIADRTLRIHGTLLVAPNADIALWSDSLLEISGSIIVDTMALQARGPLRLTTDPSRDFHDDDEYPYFGLGGLFVTVEDASFIGGCPIAVAAAENESSWLKILRTTIEASRGAEGTKAQKRGGNGCDVEIGTPRAAQLVSLNIGGPTRPFGQLDLRDSKVFGGNGGSGYTMLTGDGTITDNKWEGVAGDGGKGGNVRIEATAVDIRGSEIRPGSGGSGGFILVNLRNGSGPNGEGESLTAITGNAGAGGDLELKATRVSAADVLDEALVSPPGGVLVTGGNGQRGGAGGTLRMLIGDHSARGAITVPNGIAVTPSPVNVNHLNTATFTNAANGGLSETAGLPGGKGGDITFESAAGNVIHLKSIILDKVSNGGRGFDGCAVRPKRNGTNGGVGGALRRKQMPFNHKDSFWGGNGGDGNPTPGLGEVEGRDVDNANAPLGVRGAKGDDCPDRIGLLMMPDNFQHTIGQTSCPQLVASPTLINQSMVAITYSATISGTTALAWGNATGTLQPGASTTLSMTFNCSESMPFLASYQITGTPVSGGASETISGSIAAQFFRRAVRLNHTLGSATGPYQKDVVVTLNRIANGRLNPAHEPFCAYEHLHALSPAGIGIADAVGVISGPYPDPDTGGCGYGQIITVPVAAATVIRPR